jgi:cobalt/nickel transport system ATP-binding protein
MATGRCTATLAAGELGSHAAELAAVGLPLPEIITLQLALAGHGLLPAGARPRCAADLLAALKQAKESACQFALI